MLPKLARTISVPVPRSELLRALALCGPLALLLAADKALRLSPANDNLATDSHLGLWAIVQHSFLQPAIGSALGVLVLSALIVGALLAVLTRRRGRPWTVWGLCILLVYFAVVVGALLRGETHPLRPFVVSQALADAARLVELWWRDAAALTLLTGLIAWHLARRIRGRSLVRSTLVWSIVALAYVLAAVDIAFFIATRAPLNANDLYFGLSSPHDAWAVSHGAISLRSALVLSEILFCSLACAIAAVLLARRGAFAPSRPPYTRAVHLGLILWPALALAVASPAGTHELWGTHARDNPLLSITVRGAESGFLRMLVLHGGGTPSAIVPALHVQPITLVSTAATRPWNVIIVMLESARARDTTVYSPSLNTTPFLAELARESLVVDHMYAVIPRTADAWISILAGRYPSADKIVDQYVDDDPPPFPSSMPRLLRTAGYTSAFFRPTTRYFSADAAVVRALDFDEVVTKESIPEPASGLVTPFGWEDRALLAPIGHWLDQRVQDKRPFLLTVMTNIGHTPFDLPADYHVQRFPSLDEKHERYLNCMHYIDGYVRDLVQELRDRGLLEKSILIVLGDHGEAFGEHGSYFRGDGLYDEVLQVPMLIRLPSAAHRSGHVGGLRQEIDILPTVADALGLTLRGGTLPGSSLLSDPRGHEALFFSQYFEGTALALRIGQLKYIYHFDNDPMEIFDLERDPMERRNIEAQIPLRDRLQARIDMLTWRNRVARTFHTGTEASPTISAGTYTKPTAVVAARESR